MEDRTWEGIKDHMRDVYGAQKQVVLVLPATTTTTTTTLLLLLQ